MTTDELIARAEEREAAGHAYAAAIRAMKGKSSGAKKIRFAWANGSKRMTLPQLRRPAPP